MKNILTILFAALLAIAFMAIPATPVTAANPAAYELPEACAIMTLNGFLPDSDCDGVHDAIDNCIQIANADQWDTNHNGLGDACDLMIEHIDVSPSVILRANEFFSLNIMLLNHQGAPIHDVDVEIKNADLNYRTQTDVPVIAAGEARNIEFLLKIPRCTTEKTYPLTITTRYLAEGQEHVETTTQNIKVVPGGECNTPMTVLENTVIETFHDRDIDAGETTIIPIRVVNLNPNAVSYELRVDGMDNWATFRVDPDNEFTLPSGHDTTRYIAIETEEWEPLGENTIYLVVSTADEEESIPITLRVRQTVGRANIQKLRQAIEVTLILVLFVLLIVGLIIAYKKMNEDDEPKDIDDIYKQEGIDKAEPEKQRAPKKASGINKNATSKKTAKKTLPKKTTKTVKAIEPDEPMRSNF